MKRLFRGMFKWLASATEGRFDRHFLSQDVPLANHVSHQNWFAHLGQFGNREGMRILEVGSREVTGQSSARAVFAKAEYVGFDYYDGPNVDVVGDAHKLSTYFDRKFDIIYSSAVFEHLAMPWVVAMEIAKLLNVGGYVFVETHFSYSSHERSWHFFQFSDMGLRCLFRRRWGSSASKRACPIRWSADSRRMPMPICDFSPLSGCTVTASF